LHTDYYHGVLLASVPRWCPRALDVGCGTGAFARKLAAVADAVEAIDRDADVLARAQAASSEVSNLRFHCSDFFAYTTASEHSYDFISALASLHHLDEAMAFTRIRCLLRPGGVFAAVGLYRSRGLFDLLWSLVALPVSQTLRLLRRHTADQVPLREPSRTLGEIRRLATAVLPGAEIKRRLLWRYTLVYQAR
jgi:SAM-dependent methyltransferase